MEEQGCNLRRKSVFVGDDGCSDNKGSSKLMLKI